MLPQIVGDRTAMEPGAYRLYFLERGHIVARVDLPAREDDEALAQATTLLDGRPAELWCGRVMIRDWSGTTPTRRPARRAGSAPHKDL
jgi:hypothetical protein